MPSRRLPPDKKTARLTAEIRRLRLNLEALVQRIRDERTAHYFATAKRVKGADRVPLLPSAPRCRASHQVRIPE